MNRINRTAVMGAVYRDEAGYTVAPCRRSDLLLSRVKGYCLQLYEEYLKTSGTHGTME